MPRPGPRPYECVRRAWHSDRHQPMRGTLIQEIFRVVNEIHSSATRKNKEWQDKIPVVVLKAEEIMYSKANSEAEYMDLKTLWDRANDAINTIIRRDESTETGGLLHPCIEAALNLGCMPRRASRSQRNSNPRCYLPPIAQESTSGRPGIVESITQESHTTNAQIMSHYSNFMKPAIANSTHSGLQSHNPVAHNNNCASKKFPFSFENAPPSCSNQCLQMEAYPASNFCTVYPLYYGNYLQTGDFDVGFGVPPKLKSNTRDPAEMGALQNLLSFNIDASNKSTQPDSRDTFENPTENECDLSLRLGPLSVRCSVDNRLPQEVEDVGSSSSQEGSRFSDRLPQMDKEFPFCRRDNADDPIDSCSSKWSSEGENLNVEALTRKRKGITNGAEVRQFCWQPKLPYNSFAGRMRNAGL